MLRPILFSDHMVRAIRGDLKCVTRRVLRTTHERFGIYTERGNQVDCVPLDEHGEPIDEEIRPPYRVDDMLWVREAWGIWVPGTGFYRGRAADAPRGANVVYRSDVVAEDASGCWITGGAGDCGHPRGIFFGGPQFWRPSIYMPQEASRLSLRVLSVSLGRLQDIDELEAEREGIQVFGGPGPLATLAGLVANIPSVRRCGFLQGLADLRMLGLGDGNEVSWTTQRANFAALWDVLNNARGYAWAANPWVWRIEFAKVGGAQ